MSLTKNSWGVYGLVLRSTLFILLAWVFPFGLAVESPTPTTSLSQLNPTAHITPSSSLKTSRVHSRETTPVSYSSNSDKISSTVLDFTPTALPNDPPYGIEYSPAYNSSYGEPPPPLRVSITWSNVLYGILFICLGLVEVFHGYKYIRITLFVMGYLFFASTAMVIMLLIDNATNNVQSVPFYFSIWLLVGLAGGILSFFCWHLGLMLTAAYGGFTITVSLLAMANLENYVIRWLIAATVMIILVVVVHFYERYVIIFTTSISGSYAVMFGIDYFAGQGFRDMIELADPNGFLRFQPTPAIYAMICSVLVLAALGVAYEYKAHEEPVGHFWAGNGHRRAGSISAFEMLSPSAFRANNNTTPSMADKTTNDGAAESQSKNFRTFASSLFGRKPKARPPLNNVVGGSEDPYVIQMEEI